MEVLKHSVFSTNNVMKNVRVGVSNGIGVKEPAVVKCLSSTSFQKKRKQILHHCKTYFIYLFNIDKFS